MVRYAVAAAGVSAAAGVVGLGFSPAVRASVWGGAVLGLVVQAVCFVGFVWGASRGGNHFLAAWAGGIGLRFVALLVAGLWGVKALELEPTSALLSMAAVLFALVLLEAFSLRPEAEGARA